MSKKIKAGETVEITALGKLSAHYNERKHYIGKKVKLTYIDKAHCDPKWKAITFKPGTIVNSTNVDCIFGCKVRRIKK